MEAIILAAGWGQRLQPVSKGKTKTLLSIGGQTLLERIVVQCAGLGIEEFRVVGGYGLPELLKALDKLKTAARRFDVVVNDDFRETNTGFSLLLALEQVRGKDILIVNGDLLFHPQILKDIVSSPTSAISVDDFKELTPESIKVVIENNIIKHITKSIEIGLAHGEYIGLAKIIEKDLRLLYRVLGQIVREDKNAYYDYAFAPVSSKTALATVSTKGLPWTEIDDLKDLEHAKTLAAEWKI